MKRCLPICVVVLVQLAFSLYPLKAQPPAAGSAVAYSPGRQAGHKGQSHALRHIFRGNQPCRRRRTVRRIGAKPLFRKFR